MADVCYLSKKLINPRTLSSKQVGVSPVVRLVRAASRSGERCCPVWCLMPLGLISAECQPHHVTVTTVTDVLTASLAAKAAVSKSL